MLNLISIYRKWFPKPLLEQVLEVFDSAPGIKKLGHNIEDDYDFLRIIDLCDAFKGELLQRGILFVATDKDRVFEQISEADGTFSERCTVLTEFSAVSKYERIVLGTAYGSARDHSDKALAIAQTAAFKAMLKRASMTYGQEDEPEAPREKLTPWEAPKVAAYQKRALDEALHKVGIDAHELSRRMTEAAGEPVCYEQIAALPPKEFDEYMKVIIGWEQDLTAKWSAAVVDIRSKKAQPIVAAMDAMPEEMTGD